MIERIKEILAAVESFQPKTIEEVEEFRLKYLSKKGLIPALFDDFRNVPAEQKKQVGAEINVLKQLNPTHTITLIRPNGIMKTKIVHDTSYQEAFPTCYHAIVNNIPLTAWYDDKNKYKNRFKKFSDLLFHKIVPGYPFPTKPQFSTLNLSIHLPTSIAAIADHLAKPFVGFSPPVPLCPLFLSLDPF